ncbi:AbrB/MazE/SpoVT family DNA-binding domain-containing protein [Candidatus Saccharibacteria bacterium]|nr:AbrB/MazE/SpoVT family DNA-binding domain-containing protein [Candidatus Saccharibacteria bacterium]
MFHHIKPQIWGVTTVGERGQIVIPVKAREALNLQKGEQLVMISKGDKFIGFVKANELTSILKSWIDEIEVYKKEDN